MNETSDPNPILEPPDTPTKAAAVRPTAGQFRIRTILVWMILIFLYMVNFQVADFRPDSSNTANDPILLVVLGGLLLFAPAATCIPLLIDQVLSGEERTRLTHLKMVRLICCLGVYSCLMLVLANLFFVPEWKGSKGEHWSYYLLDDWAGMTLWPIYLLGVGIFCNSVTRYENSRNSALHFIAIVCLAAISIWYTLATLLMNFAIDISLWIVPASVGFCYSLYALRLFNDRRWEFQFSNLKSWPAAWLTFFVGSILVKIPLAQSFYQSLPDDPPPGCFIVSAAAKGHRGIVKSSICDDSNRPVNLQLANFYQFESLLKQRTPNVHRRLRAVYNVVGPMVASMIWFRWQADLVYLMLKPFEWQAKALSDRFG